MPMIRECIVTTMGDEGRVHIAPLGLIEDGDGWVIGPFRPSTTLDNLRTTPFAVANFTDDVMVFAGCLTGNKDWPTRGAAKVPGAVLDGSSRSVEPIEHQRQAHILQGRQCRQKVESLKNKTEPAPAE